MIIFVVCSLLLVFDDICRPRVQHLEPLLLAVWFQTAMHLLQVPLTMQKGLILFTKPYLRYAALDKKGSKCKVRSTATLPNGVLAKQRDA